MVNCRCSSNQLILLTLPGFRGTEGSKPQQSNSQGGSKTSIWNFNFLALPYRRKDLYANFELKVVKVILMVAYL